MICLFYADTECPAASELEDLDRQIMLRLKAEAENSTLRAALQRLADCDFTISLPDRMDAVRKIAREALNDRG
jgi:hypothetical protein